MSVPTANRPGTSTINAEPMFPEAASARRGWIARPGMEPLAVTLLFTLLTLVMTWPWALHIGEAINPFGDVIVQMTSIRWNAHALFTNPLSLFEAPFFYPYAHSLAFSENLLGQTLVGLPVLGLTGNAAMAANFNILLSFVLTGLFTYLLVRDLTGSRAAGLLAGVAFAFCPFRFIQMGHLHMLSTQWFPFTLWAMRRGLGVGAAHTTLESSVAVNRGSGAYLGWAAFGFIAMGLSSVYYIYFLALAVLMYAAWWLLVERRGERTAWGPLLLKAGLAAAAVGVVLLPVYIPYLQSNRDLGFSRSTYEVQNWEAQIDFYGKVLQSNWLYAQVLAPQLATAGGERQLFPGLVPALLAVVGIAIGRGRERFFYVLLGLAAFILTFGLSARIPGTDTEVTLPYAFLYDWVPGFKALRVPVRFAVLVDLSLYVLAGYGLAWLLAFRKEGSSRAVQSKAISKTAITTGLVALVLLEFANPLDTANRRDVMTQLREIEPYGWLSRPENRGPVLELPMSADQPDVWYTFFATKHWQPLVNGWSSFVPPGTMYLKRALDNFPDPRTLSVLQGLEVRHIVVHLWEYPPEAQADLKRRLDNEPSLELVNTAGENYVYRLAPDPWLREVAETVGDGTIWVGEARRGDMPVLEVLAYALRRWGIRPGQISGNIDIGYQPVGSPPFGEAPDYVLTPTGEAGAEQAAPFGRGAVESVLSNPAATLFKNNDLAAYDFTAPGAPTLDGGSIHMRVGPSSVAFGAGDPLEESASTEARVLRLSFLTFSPAEVAIKVGEREQRVMLAPGVSTRDIEVWAAEEVTVMQEGDAVRLLRVSLSAAGDAASEGTEQGRLPIEITPSTSTDMDQGTLHTGVRLVAPRVQGGDYTATIDVYLEPWGTHPEGHLGSWSVVVPADGTAHDYTFMYDPLAETVTTTRDGQAVETFAWVGPPERGDFRATFILTHPAGPVASVPTHTFTLNDGRITAWQADAPTLTIVPHPGN